MGDKRIHKIRTSSGRADQQLGPHTFGEGKGEGEGEGEVNLDTILENLTARGGLCIFIPSFFSSAHSNTEPDTVSGPKESKVNEPKYLFFINSEFINGKKRHDLS